VFFALVSLGTPDPARLHWQVVFVPLAIVMQAALALGVGLIVAPLVVFFNDLERAVKLGLRFLFYASPVVYSVEGVPKDLRPFASSNPLTGIISIYRAAFFPKELNWFDVGTSAIITVVILIAGILVFRRTVPTVLKEI
jgi:ABC-2 type transport system permease protein